MIKLKYLQIIVAVFFIFSAYGCQKAESQNNSNIVPSSSAFKSALPSITSAAVTPQPTPTPTNTPISSNHFVNTPTAKKGYLPAKKSAMPAAKTPQPTRATPEAIKSPIVSCDGDVCRIITNE